MTAKDLNQLVTQIETHIECWKQFNYFINVARGKKFGRRKKVIFLKLKASSCRRLN